MLSSVWPVMRPWIFIAETHAYRSRRRFEIGHPITRRCRFDDVGAETPLWLAHCIRAEASKKKSTRIQSTSIFEKLYLPPPPSPEREREERPTGFQVCPLPFLKYDGWAGVADTPRFSRVGCHVATAWSLRIGKIQRHASRINLNPHRCLYVPFIFLDVNSTSCFGHIRCFRIARLFWTPSHGLNNNSWPSSCVLIW